MKAKFNVLVKQTFRIFGRMCLGMRLGVLWLTWLHFRAYSNPLTQHVSLYKAHVAIIFHIEGYVTFDMGDYDTFMNHLQSMTYGHRYLATHLCSAYEGFMKPS